MARSKLTKRYVDALTAGPSRYTAWDSELSGFGVRVAPTGDRTYVLKYRAARQQRWLTIGRHNSPWTPELARREALKLLGQVAQGQDPLWERNAARRSI